jgi:hypothetical protein
MSSAPSNYPVESAKSRVADVFRDKFPSNASEDLRASLRAAYAAGGRSAVATLLSGRTKPLKRQQVIAAISHAEDLALAHRPSMRSVGKMAKRFALRNGAVPKFTARDLTHIEDTCRRLFDLDTIGEYDGPETIMTSLGYVEVWSDSSVTMHGVNYTLEQLERAASGKRLAKPTMSRTKRFKVKRRVSKNGRKAIALRNGSESSTGFVPFSVFMAYPVKFSRRNYGKDRFTWAYVDMPDDNYVDLGDPWPGMSWPKDDLRAVKISHWLRLYGSDAPADEVSAAKAEHEKSVAAARAKRLAVKNGSKPAKRASQSTPKRRARKSR